MKEPGTLCGSYWASSGVFSPYVHRQTQEAVGRQNFPLTARYPDARVVQEVEDGLVGGRSVAAAPAGAGEVSAAMLGRPFSCGICDLPKERYFGVARHALRVGREQPGFQGITFTIW